MFTTKYLGVDYNISFYPKFVTRKFKRRKEEGNYGTVKTISTVFTGNKKDGIKVISKGYAIKSIEDFHNKAVAKLWALYNNVLELKKKDEKLATVLFNDWVKFYSTTRCGKNNLLFKYWSEILVECLKSGADPHAVATEYNLCVVNKKLDK